MRLWFNISSLKWYNTIFQILLKETFTKAPEEPDGLLTTVAAIVKETKKVTEKNVKEKEGKCKIRFTNAMLPVFSSYVYFKIKKRSNNIYLRKRI